MEIIKIENAGKCINGKWTFQNVTISFFAGTIYGLIGHNGSGKTMLLKSISGLCRLTEGTILVNGKQIGKEIDIPDSLGAIIEVPGFLPNISGFSNLKYLARLRNKISDNEIYQAIRTVGLDPDSRKHVGKYSLGMRQRLGIAQAIMENPDILLLDEPMNGLDTQGVNDMKVLIQKLRKEGKTIILVSHHLDDIDELCNVVYKMENGNLMKCRGEDI